MTASAARPSAIRYLPRCVRCNLSAAELQSVRRRVEQLPEVVGDRLNIHGLDMAPLKATRRRWWRLKVPPFRVFFLSAGDEIIVAEIDRRDDHTYDDLSRLDRYLLVRSGEGLRVVVKPDEAAPDRSARPVGRKRAPAVHRTQQNPLTPFADLELTALGLDSAAVDLVRTFGVGVDVTEELLSRGVGSAVAELVTGAWTSPTRALEIFREGKVPCADELVIGDDELAVRAASPDSAASLAALDDAAFAAILAGTVEEWMFYLHPSQTRIVEAPATGPLRVRGGPGTGKTVAALHRARWLARTDGAERVLVTTFVNVLPKVWSELFAAFAPDVRERIQTATVDALAWRIVHEAGGAFETLQAAERGKLLDRALTDVPAARQALGGSTFAFAQELDFVVVGRGLDAAGYLSAARTGRGRALSPGQRAHIWAAYDRYTRLLVRERKTDWAHLRAEALRLAREGAGPRFDAIVVDEAQDLTETHLQLLLALDADPEHSGLMLVGDGQQAIYPGGYSLRSVGVEVRGRSFLLRTNWRNTQLIAMAAEAVVGELAFGDLDGTQAPRSRDDAPLPRRLGEPAVLHVVPAGDADTVLATVVEDILARHSPGDVAVLTPTNAEAERVASLLRPRPTLDLRKYTGGAVDAIRVGTYHRAKGLEFKVVVVLGATRHAYDRALSGLTEPADVAEADGQWTRTLFVAMTRARDELVLIASAPLAPQVDRARDDFDVEVW